MGILSKAGAATPALALEISAGFGAVEQMDDRLEPAALAHIGYNDFYATNLVFYGRSYGPVTAETLIGSFQRRWGLYQSKSLTAHFGLAVMDERTVIKYTQEQYASYNETKDGLNAGATFGTAWELLPNGPLHFAVGWDAYVFPAGGNGTAFLVTGRKETFGATMGVSF